MLRLTAFPLWNIYGGQTALKDKGQSDSRTKAFFKAGLGTYGLSTFLVLCIYFFRDFKICDAERAKRFNNAFDDLRRYSTGRLRKNEENEEKELLDQLRIALGIAESQELE